MLPQQQGFGGPAPLCNTDALSRSSSFSSTSGNAQRLGPLNTSDSHLFHVEVNRTSNADPSKPMSVADKKQQRLARNRATASVSRSRKREHLHTLQMRVSALEQENRDLLQQAAVRDAKLEQYKNDRVLPDDDGLGAQPKPAAKQPAVKSVEAIIVRPAASSLPRILCNTKVAASSSHTQQQQAPLQTDAPALSQGEAGSKRKAALDHEQTLPRQRSRSLTPSADEATPVAHVGADANLEGPAAAAPHEPLMPALSKQDNKQTTFNVITSGEQPHFMTKQQLMVKKVQPSPFAEQLEPQVMGTFASRAPFVGSHSHDVHGQPVDIDSSTGSDMQKASSRSFDSFHLPACDMPNLVFGVGSTGIAQLEAWESGFDAQLLHSELGVNAEAMPHNQDGSLTAQSKAWDWCNLVAQGLELNSQSAPDMPELPLLSEMPPVLPQHQGWQADEQNQQSEQQHLHHGSQQQQAYQALPRPHAADATCSVAAPAASCAEAGGCGSEVDWWMLPHCSMHNMFQADAVPSPGNDSSQQAVTGGLHGTLY